MIDKLWVEKYRPKTIDDYIFHDSNQKNIFTRMINNKEIPHLLLSGVQGSGKTSLSKILANSLDIDESDQLLINTSDENSVDTIREKIKGFVQSYALSRFKIVQLEEFDYATPNFQAILRLIMEEYSDTTRFILTCNYENKIIPPIRSRVQQFHFKAPPLEDVSVRIAQILINEGVEFELETLDTYIAVGYPDIRKIINLVQQNSIDGKLVNHRDMNNSSDYKFKILDLMKEDNLKDLRKYVCDNVNKEEYEEVFRFLYENLNQIPKFSDINRYESGIVMIAEYLYKHGLVADPEINLAALLIQLKNL